MSRTRWRSPPRRRQRRPASPDRDSFVGACIDHPSDATTKLVFADWCDENGEPLAAIALRWLAKHKKNPAHIGGWWQLYCQGIDDLPCTLQKALAKCRSNRRRMPRCECWLPEIVGREMSRCWPRSSRYWFVLVRRLGWALQRIRDLVD